MASRGATYRSALRRDGDRRALADGAFDLQRAAVQLDKTLRQRQSKAGAFVFPLQPVVDLTESA